MNRMRLLVLPALLAMIVLSSCESAERVAAAAACNIQCEDAETCGQGRCYDQCASLAGDEVALGSCVGCLQLAAENCDLIAGCLSSVCGADALDNPECATFCATYGRECGAIANCMGTCIAWTPQQRNVCLECVSLKGYCEAFGGECASPCGN